MAQKRDKDEMELKVPENLPICTPQPPIPPPPVVLPAARSPDATDPKEATARDAGAGASGALDESDPAEVRRAPKRPREANRCSGPGCRKRVGLVGFRCRCGDVFCAEHRYSDRHDCSYDYKAAGRAAIARENPVVRAAKLLKV